MEPIVRGLTAAAKSLRLYPPTSPIPRQAVESAQSELAAFLSSEPVLPLRVVRDGLAFGGATVAPGAPGATELADALRDHGVAEVDFLPGVTGDDLIALLTAALEKPEALAAQGGIAAVLASAGVESVRTADVSLTVVDPFAATLGGDDADGFLRELASDPDRVSAWLAVATKSDPATLSAGLGDLATAAGDENLQTLVASLASALGAQDPESRDALIGASLDAGPARDLMSKVFARTATADLASTLCAGSYGRNMLSLSSALTRMPLAERMTEVLGQVKDLLPEAGKSDKEISFLEHMLEVRQSPGEKPLTDAQPLYRQVADLAKVDAAQVNGARAQVADSAKRADDSAVTTMLTLLDQQQDFGLYCRTLEAIAGMVAPLLERGRIDLAARIVRELAAREARAVQPWPELTGKLRGALADATGRRTMKAVVSALAASPAGLSEAREILQNAPEAGAAAFVEEALANKADGLAIAERVAGRRVVDLLAAATAQAQWFQVAPLVARLAGEPDQRSQQAIEALMRRADDASRREVATGLAQAGGPVALRHLEALTRDASAEVATAAVRAVGRSTVPGAAAVLESRLAELDMDGKDFAIAREMIGALARTPDRRADEALKTLGARRALIKRGHFAEIQQLVAQAIAQRAKGGDR